MNSVFKRYNAILVILLLSQNAFGACNGGSKADLVLKEMVENYQGFLKYKDKGKVITKAGGVKEIKEFSTYFEAPDKFRFQWVEESPFNKIKKINKLWGENQSAFYLRSYKKNPEKMSTNQALSAAAGVSSGVSYQVLPWMLFQQDPCISIGLTKNKLIKEVKYLGESTYIVQRIIKGGTIEKYWVSKKSLLLYKIESHASYKHGTFVDVIKYESIEYN